MRNRVIQILKRLIISNVVVTSAFLFLTAIEAQCQDASPSSPTYIRFSKWAISFEYPAQWKEYPADRVAMMKDYIAAELQRIPNDPYERKLTEFTMITAPSGEAALLVSKITVVKPMQVEDLLAERKQVYEDAKRAGDVTRINHVKQTTVAKLPAVEEDVERSNGGRGCTVKVISETAIFELSLVVNNGKLFSDYSHHLYHIISTFAVTAKQDTSNEAPKRAAADVSDTASDSTEVRLTVQETATFRINGAAPKQRVYFGKSWSNREYAQSGLTANKKTMFPEVAQSSDSKGRTLIKYYAGVPCQVAQFQQDKLEIPGQTVIEVTAESVLRNGQISVVPEGALEVSPGFMIPFSRSRRTHGESIIHIGPVPGKQGLVIGGERSEAEHYKCKDPVEIGSYKPNLWVSGTSMIPFECDQEGLPKRAIPTAIGVIWKFSKKDTKIQIGDVVLAATVDGGTVQFTKEGPILNGVEKDKQHERKPPKQQPTAQAAEPSNMVAQIGDYAITTEELEQRLMNELRPDDDKLYEKVQPLDAREVLMKMIAEKAMVIEARKQGYLQDEQIQAPIKRFKERMLINLCLGRYFKGKQNEMAVTDAEIDKKLKTDPKMDRKRATALLQREKSNRLFDQYYNQLCKKFHVQKESRNFPKAAQIHQRLLNHPKEPRKMWWIQSSQIREELTPEEKDIVLATYDNGKVTLKDWFNALSDIAPPGRPKDLNTPQGVERLLDRPLRMAVLVAEAESLGLDKDENFIKQLRQRQDSMLLGKVRQEKVKDISDPADEQIVAYFEKNKQAFGTPNMLKIDQIWCQDLKTAREAKAELERGKDFEAVKQECSLQKKAEPFHTDPSSEGIFFEDLWKGDPNEIVGPVKGFYGDGLKWRIVKILEKKPAQVKEYSDGMKGRVKSTMMDEQRNTILAKYRKELLEKYSYEIYAERIKDIDPLELEKEPKIMSEEVRKEPKTAFEEARKDLSSLERFVRTQALNTLPKASQQEVENAFSRLLLSSDLGERFVIGAFLNVARKSIPDREKGSVTISEAGSNLVRFELEYPKDRQPFGAGGASIPVGHGSIWRFKGKVTDIMGFDFEGKENDPLRFILVDGYGLMYLYGTGAVVLKDGTVVTFPKD